MNDVVRARVRRIAAIGTLTVAILLVSAVFRGSAAAGTQPQLADPWLAGPTQPHARAASGITPANAGTLHTAWRIGTREPVSSAPIVAHGRVYFTDWADDAYVADAATGHVIWRRTLGRPHENWPWHGLAGTGALVGGTWYVASVEGTLYALDARTGAVRWKERVTHQRFAGVLAYLQCVHGVL